MLKAPPNFPTEQKVFAGLPKTLRKNPINWFPGVGFYRKGHMAEAFMPKSAKTTSNQFALSPAGAFNLGTGGGIGASLDHGHPIVDIAVGLSGQPGCDLELMARLGLTARLIHKIEPELQERIARHMCGVLGRAIPKANKWHEVLGRFSTGDEVASDKTFVEATPYNNGQPFNYTAVTIAQDVLRDHTYSYFAGLKRFDGSVHLVSKSARRRMLAETVELFEQLAVEQGAER